MFYLYHYVSPCPRCHSKQTGYYVCSDIQLPRLITRGLKKGELIETKGTKSDLNVYCSECEYEWIENIKVSFVSKNFINEQKKIRGINDEYTSAIKSMYEEDAKQYKSSLKKEKFHLPKKIAKEILNVIR